MGESWQGLRAVARVLIVNQAGEVLLCRSRNGKAWVPPGGTVDPGETLASAAVREAVEEAGIAVELGDLAYLQEFRPAHKDEHVVEAAFHARALGEFPAGEEGRPRPAGPAERPWAAWFIQDADGPVREVRWFSRTALAAVAEPVYPPFLKDRYWEVRTLTYNAYLGLVQG
jgi:ADP-ribose pyrophosphatase YjhB (NUDIX family)